MIDLEKYKQYLQARGMSVNYHNAMRIFLGYLETHNLLYDDLSQIIITDFFNQPDKNYSIQSRNMTIKAGRNYDLFLEKPDSQWRKIKLLKSERRIPNYLSENDLGKAISYLITYHNKLISSIKANAIFYILFYTGIRKGELLNLKRNDFNFEENSLKVWGQKTKEERVVYFPVKLNVILQEYFKSEPKESINAFNISLYDLTYLTKKLKSCFPQKKISIHVWRHSSARYMIEKGIPLGIVSKLLGHKSLQTTLLYTDPDQEQIKRVYGDKIK